MSNHRPAEGDSSTRTRPRPGPAPARPTTQPSDYLATRLPPHPDHAPVGDRETCRTTVSLRATPQHKRALSPGRLQADPYPTRAPDQGSSTPDHRPNGPTTSLPGHALGGESDTCRTTAPLRAASRHKRAQARPGSSPPGHALGGDSETCRSTAPLRAAPRHKRAQARPGSSPPNDQPPDYLSARPRTRRR